MPKWITVVYALLAGQLSYAAENDYIFLEEFGANTVGHYYFPFDVASETAMKQLFYTEVSDCREPEARIKFWIVRNNEQVRCLTFRNPAAFNSALVDSLKLPWSLKELFFNHPQKAEMVDSLRKNRIPFAFENPCPEYGYEVTLDCHYRPQEIDPLDDRTPPEGTFWKLTCMRDSIKALVTEAYPGCHLVYCSIVTEAYDRGVFCEVKLYLPRNTFDPAPLVHLGFVVLNNAVVTDREYWVWLTD